MATVFFIQKKLIFLEKKYISSIIKLEKEIENYIYYYNNERIKNKLKGLTPASYTKQSLLIS
ncbi:IS3 family transposase [Fusobacterium massiliense]|uniref:IS3 family transposase n=1 Tax=Fusobacterium massiliense TaxID=1852365 RepID=UPI0036F3900E